jgi:hypothetical protein
MPITSTTPIEVDGNVYPYFMINLAISPLVKPTDIGASVALRLTPYRNLELGGIEQLPDNSKAVSLLDVFAVAQSDPAFEKAIEGIMTTLQTFINDKQL